MREENGRGTASILPQMRHGLTALATAMFLGAAISAQPAAPVHVRIETAVGVIEVELDPARAPRTVANFLRYVDDGFFDGASFYRTVTAANQPDNAVKIAVIQGGVDGKKTAFDPIAIERTAETGLKHLNGTISMARNGPDTATTEFFICVGDQPELDFGGRRNPDGQGFAAFGRVTAGWDVITRIHESPVAAQRLTPPVLILRIVRSGTIKP
jgi:peptidyl-prolyl cis-trans isomerase A (cyclophilin A)